LKTKLFIIAIIFIYLCIYAGFQSGITTMTVGEAQKIQARIQSVRKLPISTLARAIFINNIYRYAEFLCPVLGTALCAYSMYWTGYIIAHAAILNPEFDLASSILSPIALMELSCYAIALAAGWIITKAILKKEKEELKDITTMIILGAIMLAFSAYAEATLIQLTQLK